jgi:hypothetical protein
LAKIAAEAGMNDNLRLARLYMIVLAIFTVGRLATGLRGVPYERGTAIFSLVTMTFLSSAFYGAFGRRWLGFTVTKAMGLGLTLGLLGQTVIVIATVLSYALHVDTYFSNPRALDPRVDPSVPISFGMALLARAGGLVVNCLMNAVIGAIGWALGALLPGPGKAA